MSEEQVPTPSFNGHPLEPGDVMQHDAHFVDGVLVYSNPRLIHADGSVEWPHSSQRQGLDNPAP